MTTSSDAPPKSEEILNEKVWSEQGLGHQFFAGINFGNSYCAPTPKNIPSSFVSCLRILDKSEADCAIVGHLFLQCSRENRIRPRGRRHRFCHPLQTYLTPDSAPSLPPLGYPPLPSLYASPFALFSVTLFWHPATPLPSDVVHPVGTLFLGFRANFCFIFICADAAS
jgi:hypothetical protein